MPDNDGHQGGSDASTGGEGRPYLDDPMERTMIVPRSAGQPFPPPDAGRTNPTPGNPSVQPPDGRRDFPSAGYSHVPTPSGIDSGAGWSGRDQSPANTTQVANDLATLSMKSAVKKPPRSGWRRALYQMTKINVGLSPRDRYEDELHHRIRRPVRDAYTIAVLGLKGGVGKTAITVALGSTLSSVRGDRILAVDADPDGGNLAARSRRESAASIAELLVDPNLQRYNDIRAYTNMNSANLEVLASADYSHARQAFSDREWHRAIDTVSRYYGLILADCGTGLLHPATRGVLSTASALVIVSSAAADGAQQAVTAMEWLRHNGYSGLLSRACIVLNHVAARAPRMDVKLAAQRFQQLVPPGRVIVVPWDNHVADSVEIDISLTSMAYQRPILELASVLSDDFGGSARS